MREELEVGGEVDGDLGHGHVGEVFFTGDNEDGEVVVALAEGDGGGGHGNSEVGSGNAELKQRRREGAKGRRLLVAVFELVVTQVADFAAGLLHPGHALAPGEGAL